jgi:sigma-E factor negative regulatory protein RseC
MEQYGLVTENKGETAMVNLQRHITCERCGRCGILSGSNRREIIVEALNPIKAEEGQRVVLESDDRRIIFISFMLYMVPIGGLLAGIMLWLRFAGALGFEGNQELMAAAAGFAMMALVFVVIRIWDRRVRGNDDYKPVITALIEELPEDCSEQNM